MSGRTSRDGCRVLVWPTRGGLVVLCVVGAMGGGCSEDEPSVPLGSGGTAGTAGSSGSGGTAGGAGTAEAGAGTGGVSGAAGTGGAEAGAGGEGGIGVALAITPVVVPEVPTTQLAFQLALDADPPSDGVRVYVRGDRAQGFTQFDLFALSVAPRSHPAPVGDLDFSGFVLLMKEREVTVSVDSFADGVTEAPSFLTVQIVPFADVPWGTQTVNGDAATVAYTVRSSPVRVELRDAP